MCYMPARLNAFTNQTYLVNDYLKRSNTTNTSAVNEFPTYTVVDKIRALSGDVVNELGVSAAAKSRAISLVNNLYFIAQENNFVWELPFVASSAFGEVTFEWWNGAKKLTLYVGTAESTYVQVWGPDIHNQMKDGVLDGDHIASQLLNWLG